METQTQTQDSSKEYFNMFQNQKYENLMVRSISKELDDYFQGGLQKGTITQVYGQAGCGKSQLAMIFSLGAISRGMPVCFLSTEKQLSWNRFTTIAYNFINEAEFQEAEKIFMYKKSSDFNQGYQFIEDSMKKIQENGKGGLLVIDSIHCFIMSCLEFHGIQNDNFQKSRRQADIVNRLRWLAKMSGSAVLIINHAADLLDNKRRGSSSRTIVPSLGPSWELNIDENIYLTRKGQIREMVIIHSPKCASYQKKCFRIQNQGFIWISEDGVEYIE